MATTAQTTFESIVRILQSSYPELTTSSRWGRRQLLLRGKVFATYSSSYMSFKLDDEALSCAHKIPGAAVWNPTNRKNPSKNSVQIPTSQRKHWAKLALEAALRIERNGAKPGAEPDA